MIHFSSILRSPRNYCPSVELGDASSCEQICGFGRRGRRGRYISLTTATTALPYCSIKTRIHKPYRYYSPVLPTPFSATVSTLASQPSASNRNATVPASARIFFSILAYASFLAESKNVTTFFTIHTLTTRTKTPTTTRTTYIQTSPCTTTSSRTSASRCSW
jgi:hypothetical protein